ncbi:MAG TPA: protein phosphatase 2C domain-containing protein [Acetobacteraceae bacterium]|jgi:protein phosphatase/serine/threonine-protein phosphatase Stp1|nr:protein phosphatase 2C domain-containing protein [Acetobacteraceae bacterium]
MTRFRSYVVTHNGAVRDHNEDNYVDRPDIGLWAVADGAGGHEAGEVASAMIAESLSSIPSGLSPSELLAQVRLRISATHQALRDEAARRGPRATIASTLVVLLARDGHFACLWAGDSRIYLLRAGQLSQVTRDHSLVQELVDAGTITAAEAEGHPRANIITRAVGAADDVLELEKVSGRLLVGDRFLLCSDGLNKTLPDGELAEALANNSGVSPAQGLIDIALARRATDNITAVTVDVEP